jgi:hypothetical protein
MARKTRTAPARQASQVAPPSPPGLRWPVRAAVVLGGLYLLSHFAMIPQALSLWGGLVSALLLGQ